MGPEIGSELGRMLAQKLTSKGSAVGIVGLSAAYLAVTIPTEWMGLVSDPPQDERWMIVGAIAVLATAIVETVRRALAGGDEA